MSFDARDLIPDPQEMVQSAAEGAQRSVGGFIGRNWLWMLLIAIAGPVIASNFRDRLPEGMGWLTGIGDFFIGLLSRIPGIGNFFGGMIQRQAENWDAEHAQERLQETAHLPEQIAEALAPDTATWQRTAAWFRTEGGTSITNPVTTRSVTRMLTTDSGREIARRLIAGATAARRAGTLGATDTTTPPPEGEGEGEQDFMQQVQGAVGGLAGGDVMQTMRATLARILRSEDGAAILNNPEAMDVLYSGVYAFTGIEFTNANALRTYMAASGLNAESQRALLVGLMGSEQQMHETLGKLIAGNEPFASRDITALHTLISGINAATLPEGMAEIVSLQGLSLEQFRDAAPMIPSLAATTTPEASGDEENTGDAETETSAPAELAALLTAEGATGAGVVALASRRSDDIPATLQPLLSNAAHADALIALANTMRDGDFAAFAAALDPMNLAEITRIAGVDENLQALRTFNTYIVSQSNEPTDSLAAWAAGDGREVVARLRSLTSLNPDQVRDMGAALSGMDEAGLQSLARLQAAMEQGNLQLFKTFFHATAMAGIATDANTAGLIDAVQAMPDAQDNPLFQNEATIHAALTLLNSIDARSGDDQGAEDDRDEDTADTKNAAMLSFVLAMANPDTIIERVDNDGIMRLERDRVFRIAGSDPEIRVRAQDLANFFERHRVELRAFFSNPALVAEDMPYRAVFQSLAANFWDDEDEDGRGDDNEGLIGFLRQGDAVGQILTNAAGREEGGTFTIPERGLFGVGLGVDTRIDQNWNAFTDLLTAMGAQPAPFDPVSATVQIGSLFVTQPNILPYMFFGAQNRERE